MHRAIISNQVTKRLLTDYNIKSDKKLTLQYRGTSNELIVTGDLLGEQFEYEMDLLLRQIGYELKHKDYVNVHIRLTDVDDDGIIFLYMLLQKLNSFSAIGKDINIFWNTLGDDKIMKIATEFEKKIDCQMFSVGNFLA